MNDFNARFSLFNAKEKKSELSPDMSGTIEVKREDIGALREYLLNAPTETNYKDEQVIKLRISGWNTESKGGLQYINGLISPQQQQQAAPANKAEEFDF